MSMTISVRTSDPSPLSRAFPWPVLEAGNGSYPDGVYSVSIEHKITGRSFALAHEVRGANLIETWIDEGKVLFVCSVAAPVSAYRMVHVSDVGLQVVEWDTENLGSYPLFTPMLVSREKIKHTVDATKDGVSLLWHGKKLNLLKGSRISVGSTFAMQSGVRGLLDMCLKEDYSPGVLKVEPSREEGFRFKVFLAEDLFYHLQYHGQDAAGANIMTHIVSASLTYLRKEVSGDDGDEGWESYVNLRALADLLESKELGHWSDDDFEPELVATTLYPHRIPAEK